MAIGAWRLPGGPGYTLSRGGAGRAAVRRGRFDSPPGAARRGGPWARAFRLRRDGRLVQRESGRPMGRAGGAGRAPGLLKLCGAARFSRSRSRPAVACRGLPRPAQAYPGLPHLPPLCGPAGVISRWVIMPRARAPCAHYSKNDDALFGFFLKFIYYFLKYFKLLDHVNLGPMRASLVCPWRDGLNGK